MGFRHQYLSPGDLSVLQGFCQFHDSAEEREDLEHRLEHGLVLDPRICPVLSSQSGHCCLHKSFCSRSSRVSCECECPCPWFYGDGRGYIPVSRRPYQKNGERDSLGENWKTRGPSGSGDALGFSRWRLYHR